MDEGGVRRLQGIRVCHQRRRLCRAQVTGLFQGLSVLLGAAGQAVLDQEVVRPGDDV